MCKNRDCGLRTPQAIDNPVEVWNRRPTDKVTSELVYMVEAFIEITQHCSISTGCCMCGDEVDSHSYTSGHSPVDSGWYHTDQTVNIAKQVLNRAERLGIKPVMPTSDPKKPE